MTINMQRGLAMIKTNEDKKLVAEIRQKLKDNGGYCPCRLQKTPDTKCMCKEFREQEEGECHCGLYVKIKEWWNIDKKYIPSYIGTTKSGLKYEVINYQDNIITIRFLNTNYILKTNSATLAGGYIKDPYEPSVCNVGYLGECDSPNRSQEYTLWRGLIERCYNPKRQDYKCYGAKGVTVCDRWKCFANFIEDIKKIDGYDDRKFHNKELDLDKDIKQSNVPINNKVYSLETCQFISKHINRAIVTRKKSPNIKIISQKGDYVLETDCPVNELANKLNIKTQYITRILRGEAKTHNGWTFKYG